MKTAFGMVACALLAVTRALAAPPSTVEYTVDVETPSSKRLRVSVVARGVQGTPFVLALPAWSPGWYVIGDAHKGISGMEATDSRGMSKTVESTGERRWRVDPAGADTVTVRYTVEANDTGHGFFKPHICSQHAFVPGPTTLVYAESATQVPCTVEYRVPDGWSVLSGNDPVSGSPTTFKASSYDTLADHPADLGKVSVWKRDIAGTPVTVVAVGNGAAAADRLADRLFRLNETAVRVLGPAPFPRYTWHVHLADDPSFMGGLEHLNSCVLRIASNPTGSVRINDLRLAAHELVHAWIVKRVRPVALGPFDYSQPVRTPDLWFLEGVVDTLAPRLVVASGFADEAWWRDDVANQLETLLSTPARKLVSVGEASTRVWEAGNSSGYGGVSYYNKGYLLGWWLDTTMLDMSPEDRDIGLAELVRDLLIQCKDKGYAPGGIERTVSKLSNPGVGAALEHWVRGTDEPDWAVVAQEAGLILDLRRQSVPWFGLDTRPEPGVAAAIVTRIEPDSPAFRAGLRRGDRIVDLSRTQSQIAGLGEGDTLTLFVVRDGDRFQTVVTPVFVEKVSARLSSNYRATARQLAIRRTLSGVAFRNSR